MDRQQFIDTLERTLRGGGTPEHIIADNVRYYNGYFADESAKGRSEAEIAEELGDPRLLAKTILEVQEPGGTVPGDLPGAGMESRRRMRRTALVPHSTVLRPMEPKAFMRN